jgi:hypothetical protein
MSTNSTAIVQLGGAVALTEVEAAIMAELADEGNAYDVQFPRVKVATGGNGFYQVGDKMEKEFTAIVAISQKIRGYWPTKSLGLPPMCSSPDGLRGLFNASATPEQFDAAMKAPFTHPGAILLNENRDMPAAFPCDRCPLNQWGSEHQRGGNANGSAPAKGKACKEMRRLFLLIDGFSLPALFNLPPTSIRAWDSFCSALGARRSAYFAVKCKFTLDAAKSAGGQDYNIVKVTPVGNLDVAQIGMVGEIRRQYKEFVAGLGIGDAEYDDLSGGEGSAAPVSAPTIHVAEPADDIPFDDAPAEQGTLINAPRGKAYN